MIKKMFSLVFAGMVGGLITFGGLQYYLSNHQVALQASPPPAQSVSKLNLPAGGSAVPASFTTAARKAMPAVVHITAAESADLARQRRQNSDDPFQQFFGNDFFFGSPFGGNQPRQGSGSGVIISEDGYIVTNNHVVEFADEVMVTLFDNHEYQASVVGTDPKTDLAVLKIEASGLPVMRNADSDLAEVGQWVLAVGNPFDLTSTVTAGIISAKGRNINIINNSRDAIEAFIQTDAAVNPGNSGGALVDTEGQLLGINTAIATQTGSFSGYSFAIPVNMVTRIVNDIIEYGSYQRGYLGINISDLDNERADELNLQITQGVIVESLVGGGAAEFAGLLPNDVIIGVNGRQVKSVPELQELVGRAQVGEVLDIDVNRNGDSVSIPVKLRSVDE
ncbi:MAG: trypsin-like peptidase domain-containing protein [Bacteroidota bacterium]